MRAPTICIALLTTAAIACSNDSKLQDTAMHRGVAGTNGGDTSRATANTSGTGVQTGSQVAPTAGAPTSPTTATTVGGTSKNTGTDSTAAKNGAKKP